MKIISCFLTLLLHLSSLSVASAFSTRSKFPRVGSIGQEVFGVSQVTKRTHLTVLSDSSTSSDTTEYAIDEESLSSTNLVQRYYETFEWTNGRDEYNINYRVEGPVDGPPVLLVHGFGANVNHFRFQFPAFAAAGYRVYGIDLLGFGASDKPKDAKYSIELWVQLLSDFLQAMNSKSEWVVTGNSIGGLCCLGLAKSLPEIIRGVVVFNTAGGMSSFNYEKTPLLLHPILYFIQKVILGNPSFGADFFDNFKTRENVESILSTQGVYCDTTNVDEELLETLLGPSDDDGAREVFLRVFGGDAGPSPESFLPFVECPILALWGESDPWTLASTGRGLSEFSEKYRIEVLPETGHCPHDERPELVNKYTLDFIKELDE